MAIDVSAADESLCVRADAPRLEQVLINLLSNAIDATAGVDKPSVSIAASRADDMVLISVQDNGVGLSEEIISHLFEPFFTTKAPEKGVGLGLATCFTIVKQYGGSISIDSAPGQGTTVTVYFPYIE